MKSPLDAFYMKSQCWLLFCQLGGEGRGGGGAITQNSCFEIVVRNALGRADCIIS